MAGSQIRKRHRALVLGVLRADGPLTKAEIARRLGLSVPTVTEILRGFETEGVVVPTGERRSSGGRRPMLYDVRTDGLRAVGVNVDHDRIRAVVSDLSGSVSSETTVEVDLDEGEEAFVDGLRDALRRLLSEERSAIAPSGIGIALPTMMRRSAKGVFLPLDRPGWKGVDLPAVLGEHHLPVVVGNRAHAVGIGEYLFGAGRGHPDLLCVVLGWGIGAAILSGGRLFVGGDGGAGALGRMYLDAVPSGKAPEAPTVGDLVGVPAIERAAGTGARVDDVIDAALQGDPPMRAVLADVGHVVGAVIATTLCVTDSELVLLCGATMRAGELVAGPAREALRARCPVDPPEIRVGELGAYAGPLGAAALVLNDHVADALAGTGDIW